MTWLLCDYGEVLSLPQPAADRAAIEVAAGRRGEEFWADYWRHRPDYDRAMMMKIAAICETGKPGASVWKLSRMIPIAG